MVDIGKLRPDVICATSDLLSRSLSIIRIDQDPDSQNSPQNVGERHTSCFEEGVWCVGNTAGGLDGTTEQQGS